MIDSAAGERIAAPSPWTPRATISHASDWGQAGARGDREHGQPEHENPPAPEQVRRPAAEQQEAAEGQGVGVDDPLQVGLGEVQRGLDRGQRDVHDRGVEHDHELGGAQQDQSAPASGLGHEVVAGEVGDRGLTWAVAGGFDPPMRPGPRSGRLRVVIERGQAFTALSQDEFDVVVVGGGITGAGVALDAATRGYSVALLERADFASGTSSRSSKLVHGGLRYLQNFDLGLVREALLERQLMVALAPHLVRPAAAGRARLRRRSPRSPGRGGAEPLRRDVRRPRPPAFAPRTAPAAAERERRAREHRPDGRTARTSESGAPSATA